VTGGYLLTVRNSSDQLPTSTTSPAQDSTAWEAALAGRNVASYEHYLKQYPTGIFAQVARDSLGISSEELNIEVAGKNSILQQPVLEKTDIQLSNTISEENKVENSAASAKGKIKKWEEKSQWAGIVFSEGLARVDADGKYGYINPEGDVVIPLKYDNGLGFSEGLAGVEIQGKWGYINKEGKIVIAAGYDDAYDFFGDIAEVSLKDKSGVYKQGYINKQGKIIVPVKYATLDRFSEGLSMVSLDNRWGFVDRSGNEVIPLKYHAARDFKNGIAAVYDGKQWFYINKQGECVKNCPD
jgi:hypothetical protein